MYLLIILPYFNLKTIGAVNNRIITTLEALRTRCCKNFDTFLRGYLFWSLSEKSPKREPYI